MGSLHHADLAYAVCISKKLYPFGLVSLSDGPMKICAAAYGLFDLLTVSTWREGEPYIYFVQHCMSSVWPVVNAQ